MRKILKYVNEENIWINIDVKKIRNKIKDKV